jgi:hypothetical protein
MNDDKLYLSNSGVMDVFYKQLVKPMKDSIIPFKWKRAFDPCQPIYINVPAYTVYSKDNRGLINN